MEDLLKQLQPGSYALVLPSKDGYGCNLLYIDYRDGNYYRSDPQYLLFENADTSFFDGSR